MDNYIPKEAGFLPQRHGGKKGGCKLRPKSQMQKTSISAQIQYMRKNTKTISI